MWTDSKKRTFVFAFLVICVVTVKVKQGYRAAEDAVAMRGPTPPPPPPSAAGAGDAKHFPRVSSVSSNSKSGSQADELMDREALYDEDDSFEVLWNVHRRKIDPESYLFHVKVPKCADK